MKNYNFIRTSDIETAERLRKIYNEVSQDGKYFVFVNDVTMKFSNDIDQSKISYTNKLCV